MSQDHVMSLLRAAQHFFFDAEKHIEKQIKRLPLTEKAKSNLQASLKAACTTPKIVPLPQLGEKELALLVRHITEDVMAFKEFMESITVFLTTHLVIYETTVRHCAQDFAKQPLYLKPVKCFGSSKTILFASLKYKKIYDCLRILDTIENNLDFIDSELSVFNLDTRDYAHFTRIINSNLRNINKESYCAITRVYNTLKLDYSPEDLQRTFFTPDYYFDKRYNTDRDHILTMLEHFTDVVEKTLGVINDTEQKFNGFLKQKNDFLDFKKEEHLARPFGGRVFYTFTYLESRRKTFSDTAAINYAINFNALNRHRLMFLAMLLSKTLGDLKANSDTEKSKSRVIFTVIEI